MSLSQEMFNLTNSSHFHKEMLRYYLKAQGVYILLPGMLAGVHCM